MAKYTEAIAILAAERQYTVHLNNRGQLENFSIKNYTDTELNHHRIFK